MNHVLFVQIACRDPHPEVRVPKSGGVPGPGVLPRAGRP